MRKFILFTAFCTMVFASCNKEASPLSANANTDGKILFGVKPGLTIEASTKAITETVLSSLDAGFKVAAVKDADNSVMFNTDVAKSESVWAVPSTSYYFPESGTMSFYAVYPTQTITVTGGNATITFDASAANVDLVTAKKTSQEKQLDPVELVFDHVLAQASLTVKAKDATVDYYVDSIKIAYPRTGAYTYSTGMWATEGSVTKKAFSTTTMLTTSSTAVGEAMTFVPGNITITVYWTCKKNSVVVASYGIPATVNIEKGKKTTINMTLTNGDAAGITFTTSVNAWGTASKDIVVE